jgi:hypothetical protein
MSPQKGRPSFLEAAFLTDLWLSASGPASWRRRSGSAIRAATTPRAATQFGLLFATSIGFIAKGGRAVNRALRNWGAALIATTAGLIIAADAQQGNFGSRWPQDAPPPVPQMPPAAAQQNPPAAEPSTKRPSATGRPASGPAVAGTWSGPVTQVGSESKYSVMLTLTASGGESSYPELNCTGKLTRIGTSRSYVFFVEVITKGQIDKGGRCPDGTITVTRAGDTLYLAWFGVLQDDAIVAFGNLARKAAR